MRDDTWTLSLPTADDYTRLGWYFHNRGDMCEDMDSHDAVVDFLRTLSIAVFPKYSSDSVGYQGVLYVVVWGTGPESVTVVGHSRLGLHPIKLPLSAPCLGMTLSVFTDTQFGEDDARKPVMRYPRDPIASALHLLLARLDDPNHAGENSKNMGLRLRIDKGWEALATVGIARVTRDQALEALYGWCCDWEYERRQYPKSSSSYSGPAETHAAERISDLVNGMRSNPPRYPGVTTPAGARSYP